MKPRKDLGDSRAEYIPTPEQIKADAQKIREEWGELETERRTCVKPRDVETREVRILD